MKINIHRVVLNFGRLWQNIILKINILFGIVFAYLPLNKDFFQLVLPYFIRQFTHGQPKKTYASLPDHGWIGVIGDSRKQYLVWVPS